MVCKNCGNEVSGNFCSICGQKSSVKKINLKYILNEIPNSILQLNRGFLYTAKELTIRPGHCIRAFLAGKRVRHYQPVAFLLITTSLYILATYLMDRETFFYDMLSGFVEGMQGDSELTENKYLLWIYKFQIYFPLVVLLFFSISTYLAFYRSQYNYFEHLVINLYITGQQMILYFIFTFIFFKDNSLLIVPILIGMAYNSWTFIQLFEHKKLYTKLGLIILVYLIFISLLVLFALLIFGVAVIVYKLAGY